MGRTQQTRRQSRSPYGGMTEAQYCARLDAWVDARVAQAARRSAAQIEQQRQAWRRGWDALYAAVFLSPVGDVTVEKVS